MLAAEGQSRPDVIVNQSAATPDAEDESTQAISLVENKLLEPNDETKDATAEKSNSDDEGQSNVDNGSENTGMN